MKITELLLHHINECSKYYNICNGIKIDIENSVADFINKEYLHYSFIHENKKKYYCREKS